MSGNIVKLARRMVPLAGLVILMNFAYAIFAEWRGLWTVHFLGYDYAFSYNAFATVLHHRTSWSALYNVAQQHTFLLRHHFLINPHNQYVYPPQFAWLLSPLALLPFPVSAVVWSLTSVVLYYVGLFYLAKLLWPRIQRVYLLILFVSAAVLQPFELDVGVGNVNSVLFAAVALAFYFLYHKRNHALAGLALALAILIKVTPAAILLVFLLRKEWKFIGWTSGFVALATFLDALFAGVNPILQYLLHFSALGHTSMGNGPAPYNQSLIGVLGMLSLYHSPTISSGVVSAIFVTCAVVSLWAMVRTLRRSQGADWRLDMALAGLTPLVFSPLVEQAHMLLILPSLMVFVRLAYEAWTQQPPGSRWVAHVLTWVSLISFLCLSLPATFVLNFVVAHWPQLFWVHIQMFVVIVLSFAMALWLFRRPAFAASVDRRFSFPWEARPNVGFHRYSSVQRKR